VVGISIRFQQYVSSGPLPCSDTKHHEARAFKLCLFPPTHAEWHARLNLASHGRGVRDCMVLRLDNLDN
jgi:hypothetical protein